MGTIGDIARHGSRSSSRGVERKERSTLTLGSRLVDWGLVSWYLCYPICERSFGNKAQKCAYQFVCYAFASFSDAGHHTGPVLGIVRVEEVKPKY